MQKSSTEQIFLWILKVGLWAIPFLPLYVSSSMLFPFITGKNFAFRILVEILLVLWVWLAVYREEYRPRLTPLFKAATIFIAILFLADLFSPNPWRSFFSNYERMEGFMMLSHLYLYFVMLSSVFRKNDWIIFFHSTLIASFAVALIGLLQKFGYRVSIQGGFRVDSTIGNPTYLAAYLLFHVWILGILIHRFWKRWWLTALYAALGIFELLILYFTATRGAALAFLLGLLLFAGVWVVWGTRMYTAQGRVSSRVRLVAGALLVLVLLVPVTLWLLRGTSLVSENLVLQRLTNYSLEERTIQSRFMIWSMAWEGFLDRPILGWGQENFYLVFQKYFRPGLFSSEPWFDRSHNVIFDWLIHTGIAGLAAWLAMFAAAFLLLVRGARRGTIPPAEAAIIGIAFITYFLQNLFVFDNLNTYLMIFAILAYVQFLSRGDVEAALVRNRMRERGGLAYGIAGGLAVLLLIAAPSLHIKSIRQSMALIDALQTAQSRVSVDALIEGFQKALSYHSFGTTEVREQIGNMGRGILESDGISPEDKSKFGKFAIEEMRQEIASPSRDVKHMLFFSALLARMGRLDNSYLPESEATLLEAIRLSPTKQILYFELAQLYLATGNTDRGIAVLQKAWDIDRNYQEAGVNLLTVALLAKNTELAASVKPQLNLSVFDDQALARLGLVYRQVGDLESALEVYALASRNQPRNSKYHATYAALLGYFGRVEEAEREVAEAVRLDPHMEAESKMFLEILETNGRIPAEVILPKQ